MESMPRQRSMWARGALRQRKFQEQLDVHLSGGAAVWFVAMQPAQSGRLARWWTIRTGSASVLAVANERVHEIPIGGNPALSMKLMFRHAEAFTFEEAAVRFDPDAETVAVAEECFSVWPYFQREAVDFCVAAGAAMPAWATS